MRNTHSTAQSSILYQKITSTFSWLFFVVSVLVCLLGLYVAAKQLLDKPVANLEVTGSELTSLEKAKLHQVLSAKLDGNYFTADLPMLLSEAKRLSWLEEVELTRQWPNTLKVSAKPYFAVARFGSSRYLSAAGEVFVRPLHMPDNGADLPILYGESHKTNEMMLSFNQVRLWFEPLGFVLSEVAVTDQDTWFFKFKKGLRVIVDRQNAQQKLYYLSYLAANQLKPYMNDVESVDLRYRNGMAVLWRQGTPPKGFSGQLTSNQQAVGRI